MRRLLLGVVYVCAAALPSLAASAVFRDYRDYLLSSTPNAAAIADVNNDGLPDVLIAESGTAVLLGHADGTFIPAPTSGRSSELSLAVADFNNDGKPDIAATILTNGTQITLAFGNGNGTFQKPKVLPIGCIDCFLAAADFNGDGNVDLAVASTSSVTVYLGNGDGTFRAGPASYSASFVVAIAVGDANRDGKPDLVVSDFGAGTLIVLLGNGDGSFTRSNYPNGSSPYQAVLADFNGDGLPDLAAPDRDSDTVLVRLNQGGGVFGPATPVPAGCSPFDAQNCLLEGLAAGDFNHDGKMDLATPGGILHGNGDGTFQPVVNFYAGATPTFVASGDFNGDHFSDLVVGNTSATNVSVLFGNTQSVSQPLRVPAGSRPKAVASGDFNGDGKADLAIASSGVNKVLVLLGNGNGGFTQAASLPVQQPGAVIALDLNGDGKTDLVVGSDFGLFIFLGQGDGTFILEAEYSAIGDCTPTAFSQTPAPCLAAGDFNGDGIPDLAAGNWIAAQVVIFLGNGDGTLRVGQTLSINDTPQGIAAADLNHDGRVDLAVSGAFGSVSVFPGNGDGTFGTAVTFRAGSTAGGLAIGDMDSDGIPDIVVAGSSGSSLISLDVFVATGNGNLTFNAPKPVLADGSPNGVVLGDFNGDGLLDIASADYTAYNLSVMINHGSLKFLTTRYGAGAAPSGVIAADLNGDRKLDLITVNQFSGDLSVAIQAVP